MIKAAKKGFRAFLGFEEGAVLASADVAKKVSFLAVGRFIYAMVDWVIAAGLGSFSFWMQARGCSTWEVFLGTAAYDTIAAAILFYASDATNCDFTLGQSLRRLADSFSQNGFVGKISAGMLLFAACVKAILWEGPEVICFLFQKELGKKANLWIALVVLSAVQGVFGTWLYTTGYGLWNKLGAQFSSHYVLLGVATFFAFVLASMLVSWMAKWAVVATQWLHTTRRLAIASGVVWTVVIVLAIVWS